MMNPDGQTIGIMTVNGFDFHPNGRFRQEAEKKGHRVMLMDPYGVGCVIDGSSPRAFFADDGGMPDLVMPRQGSPMGEYGFVLLRQFEAMGLPIINGIDGVTIARNQYMTLQHLSCAGLPVPASYFVTREDVFFEAVRQLGGYPVVVKQVDGMGGDGVAVVGNADDANSFLGTRFVPRKGVVVQSFLDPLDRKDLRILVIGGRVAGTMALTPAPGQFRSNIHQQGRPAAFDLPAGLAELATRAARACRLEIAGVDMLVSAGNTARIIEVNYSPGFRGLEQATGLNIAGMILDHVLGLGTEKD